MLIALISFPVMAGMGVIADPMIRSILGPKWIGAIRVFQILAPVGLVQSVQTTVGQIYMAKSRTDLALRWNIVVCVLLVSSFLVGIHWGILGVATAYCITFLGLTVIPGFIIPFRLIGLKLSEFARALRPQLLITAGMSLACIAWMRFLQALGAQNSWFILSSTVVLGAAVYILSMLVVWPPVLEYLETVMTASGRSSVALLLARAKGIGSRTRK